MPEDTFSPDSIPLGIEPDRIAISIWNLCFVCCKLPEEVWWDLVYKGASG